MIGQIQPCTFITGIRLLQRLPARHAHIFGSAPAPSHGITHCTRRGLSVTASNKKKTSSSVQLPLVEQPPIAAVPAQTLLDWYSQQQADVHRIGHDLSETMDAPTATDLQVDFCIILPAACRHRKSMDTIHVFES